jgi:hypothetical protein
VSLFLPFCWFFLLLVLLLFCYFCYFSVFCYSFAKTIALSTAKLMGRGMGNMSLLSVTPKIWPRLSTFFYGSTMLILGVSFFVS